MKKRIGILLRADETYHLNKELVKVLLEYDVIPIGIVSDTLENMIEISKDIDGFILQGGSSYESQEIEFVRYLYNENIPTLGICLGMQMMGIMAGGKLDFLSTSYHNSQNKYVHLIYSKPSSKLYDIIGCNPVLVNSRHKEYLMMTNLQVSAYTEDGVIEAIEDPCKKFFIGVQWHPEYLMDSSSYQLFTAFIHSIE